ncbi:MULTISPECIES: hypothetical protein [unclassified Leeuwenhoekiella]|uniref:hypothetical protein n=1 Tax=unclassified Leeuwenhoekiella TaxID=2615029 RepID=UPI000C39E807|nr:MULTISPECIES: hypothetical protein [unclassified Leeuwenhoekiella]MAW94452.1 hypothetical protein [Leeuwenhoekiella sp.]MBA81130.1 hypothetical protein [Leeuwenhoekiella sp.]|tara:strand:+ start:55793 stop:56005 length:213 start_codon:yes stop_codon:yes gene_type:complete
MKNLFLMLLVFSTFFSHGMEEEMASEFCHSLAEGLANESGLTGEEYTRKYAEEYHWCENNDWELQEDIQP